MRLLVFTGFYFCLCSIPLVGQKTDTVILVNHDRVIGEIQRMVNGKLSLKTDYLGTVSIEWDDILGLASPEFFEIQHRDLQIYRGILGFGSRDSLVRVNDQKIGSFEDRLLNIVRIDPLKLSFWRRFDGYFDAGLSFTKASDILQITFDGSVRYRSQRFFSEVAANTLITNTKADSVRTRKGDLSWQLNWTFAKSLYLKGFIAAQRNSELGIRRRLLTGGGVGKDLIRTPFTNLGLTLGLTSNRELYENDQGNKNSMEGLVAVQFNSYRYDLPELDLTTSAVFLPGITEGGRYRLELDLNVRLELIKEFYVALSIYDHFDNRPPEDGNRNDWGVVTSLGYSF